MSRTNEEDEETAADELEERVDEANSGDVASAEEIEDAFRSS